MDCAINRMVTISGKVCEKKIGRPRIDLINGLVKDLKLKSFQELTFIAND